MPSKRHDSIKASVPVITSHHQLAMLYLEPLQQRFNKDLNIDTCEDVRVLLQIICRAGCFTEKEGNLAKRLKEFRNQLAHEGSRTFTKEFYKEVTTDILTILEEFESNHGIDRKYRRELKQLKKFGTQYFLKNNINTSELSTLKNSSIASSDERRTLLIESRQFE